MSRLGQITLVTGGARSGKSQFAESFFSEHEQICYIATSGTSQDDETRQRILLHQNQRPSTWQTHEAYLDLAEFLTGNSAAAYLLDCATMLTTNYCYYLLKQRFGEDYQEIDRQLQHFSQQEKADLETEILAEWQKIVAAARNLSSDLVIVTNEVGLGIVPEDAFTRWFRDVFGRVNQFLGKEADEAFLVIAGIPMKLK